MALVQRLARPVPAARRRPRKKQASPTGTLELGRLGRLIGFGLRLAQLAVFRDFNEHLAASRVTTAQFSALCLVRDNPGVSQVALAEALRTEPPRVVTLIDRLARRGYVIRLSSTVDRRASALHLTGEGARVLRKLTAIVTRHDRAIEKRLRHGNRELLLRMLADIAR